MKFHVFFPRNRIINILILFFLLGININYIHSQDSEYGNFPYEESLLGTSSSSIGYVENAIITNNGVQLTSNIASQFGGIYIKDRQFGSKNGVVIEFDYEMSGGTGGDGLCMFLFDASISTPTIGSRGAAIGYSNNNVIYPYFRTQQHKGLTGGYMGVAFDAYGNYKTLRFQRNEMIGGIPYYVPPPNERFKNMFDVKENQYDTGSQVTIRGAQGAVKDTTIRVHYQKITPTPEMPYQPWMDERQGSYDVGKEGFTGYPVLITQSTDKTHGFALNSDGRYMKLGDYTGNKFSIIGSNKEYRKAIIELFPVEEGVPGKGFYVTVKIQHGDKIDTIINDYQYKESVIYYENGMVPWPFNSDEPRTDPPIRTLNSKVPKFLRIGFAAATGEKTNNHFIRNIKVALPRAAEAEDDSLEIFKGQAATFYPLVNDIAYNGTISRNQTGSIDHIDLREFRFTDNNGRVEKLASGQTVLTCGMPEGIWTYDITGVTDNSLAKVTFTPKPGYDGVATVQYDIKGKDDAPNPYADEAYRSLHATISAKVIVNPNPTRNTVTNKMITIKYK